MFMTGKNVPIRPPGLCAHGPDDGKYYKYLILNIKKVTVSRIQMAGDVHLTSEDSHMFTLNKEFDDESE
jgi:hypothetical protein